MKYYSVPEALKNYRWAVFVDIKNLTMLPDCFEFWKVTKSHVINYYTGACNDRYKVLNQVLFYEGIPDSISDENIEVYCLNDPRQAKQYDSKIQEIKMWETIL